MPGGEEDEGTSIAKETSKSNLRARRPERGAANRTSTKDIIDTDELETKLDEVNNHEDHRLKGGRELKKSS
jgi:hypothetical protein